ncbi:MAG: malectin domain-containing carbohydrate-binding protein [Microscillaceae bacterium]|nr:malectin domain-containing carbohydrate-binding protein [Microscillaceae bacterium]
MKNNLQKRIIKLCFLTGLIWVTVHSLSAQCIDGCDEISALNCTEVIKSLPYELSFNGNEGGLKDKNGLGTGFTMVQKHSAARLPEDSPVSCPVIQGYEPSRLLLASNQLTLKASKGIAFLAPPAGSRNNTQVNTLGIGLESFNKQLIVETKILNLKTGQGFAQTGLWYGLNEDNYIKFAAINENSLELRIESNGTSSDNQGIVLNNLVLTNQDLTLTLEIDNRAPSPTVTATFALGNAPQQTLGTLDIPQNISDGITLGTTNKVSFAGIYASYRNGITFDVAYDAFKIQEVSPADNNTIRINFSDLATVPPTGWLHDYGQAFSLRNGPNQGTGRSYGWVQETNFLQPVNFEGRGRKRTSPTDILQATFMHMQVNGINGAWEIELENGKYQVEVSVGDGGGFTDSRHTIRAEGITIINNFLPSPNAFKIGSAICEVSDGKLTLDAIGGQNTKINRVVISKVLENPKVIAFNLSSGQTEVPLTPTIETEQIELPNGPLDPQTINPENIKLIDQNTQIIVESSVASQNDNKDILLTPNNPLKPGNEYTLQINEGVKDITGTSMLPVSLNFTTEIPPTPSWILKVNFQDAATMPPTGWVKDDGRAFGIAHTTVLDQEVVYGWVDATTRTSPLDLSTLGQNQNPAAQGDMLISSSFMPMQALLNGVTKEGLWEAQIPNGKYLVTVHVGDPSNFDSQHSIRIEGVKAIDRFIPTAETPFASVTVPVMVADGKLTVDAFGGINTKINSLMIELEYFFPVFTWKYKINFQTQSTVTPAGYIADKGQSFGGRGLFQGEELTFGWLDGLGQSPIAYESQMRDRAKTPTERFTLAHLQNPNDVTWRMSLPNGLYQIKVASGDTYTNSHHLVNAEGVNVLTFNQEAANTTTGIAEGTTVVEIKDGNLTLDPFGGTNSKINYIWIGTIEPQNDNIAPHLSVNIQGNRVGSNIYQDEVLIQIEAYDLGGAGLRSLEFNVNNQGWQPYVNVLFLNEIGNYHIQARATDANGNQKISPEFQFELLNSNGTLSKMVVENMDHFPNDHELTFSRIQIPWRNQGANYNANHDVVFLRIHNRGLDDLKINQLKLNDTLNWTIQSVGGVAAPQLSYPLNIGPGSRVDVALQFIAVDPPNPNRDKIKVLETNLEIFSDDIALPYQNIILRGLWQKEGESHREPIVREIIEAFGFKTDPGFENYKHGSDSTLKGDEISVMLLERADPALPVTVRHLASYQGCCAYGTGLSYEDVNPYTQKTGKGIAGSVGVDTQTLLPRSNTNPGDGNFGSPSSGSFVPLGPFNVRVAQDCSNPYLNPPSTSPTVRGYIGIRFWKVRNSAGEVVPNAYLMSNDYLGSSGTNYDYNDNMFYITNVRPYGGMNNHSELATGNGIAGDPLENQSAVEFQETGLGSSQNINIHLRSLGRVFADKRDPDIVISSLEIQGDNPDEFIIETPADLVISPQESTTFQVSFVPNHVGFKRAFMLVHYNSANSPLRIPLSGIATTECVDNLLIKRIKTAQSTSNSVTIGGASWESDLAYRAAGYTFKLNNTTDQSSQIKQTDQDALYRSYTSSNADNTAIGYKIALPESASYLVRLHFAENYWTDQNKRVFHILLEGTIVEIALDLMAEAGFKTALVKDYEVIVSDGALDLELLPIVNRPVISAIEIYRMVNQGSLSLNVVDVNSSDCSNQNGSLQVELNSQKGSLYKLGKYGVYQESPAFNHLTAGIYHIYAKESNSNCEFVQMVQLDQNVDCQTVLAKSSKKTAENTDKIMVMQEEIEMIEVEEFANDQDMSLHIYPNPFINQVTITGSDMMQLYADISLEVYDGNGNLLFKENGSIKDLNKSVNAQMQSWYPGVYIFKVQAPEKVHTFKMVKR